jgi:hypothetical protein
MTPQERQLVDDLFDRLSKVEGAPRDPEAAASIVQGMRKAPNAIYALVQTTLLQDEALKRAHERIQELEARGTDERPQSGGFLDTMRETIFGQNPQRGSVPSVRPPELPSRPTWNSGQVMQQAQVPGQYGQTPYGQPYGGSQAAMGGGGSFLGTAADAAAVTVPVRAPACSIQARTPAMTARARDGSTPHRTMTTMTTWISTRMISAATATPPDGFPSRQSKTAARWERPSDFRHGSFRSPRPARRH